MLQIIKNYLFKIIDDIDTGNSNIPEEKQIEIATFLKEISNTEKLYNRTQAAKYLHCSIQTFDLYRKEGKIPEGRKESGGVMQWTKRQLDDFISKYKQ